MRKMSVDGEEDGGAGESHEMGVGSAGSDEEVEAGASSMRLAAEDRELVDGLAHAVADGARAADRLLDDVLEGAAEGLDRALRARP
mmetsp:Transcript_94566/g.267690  ORF Transcript_94566/g.267690 Transcript_94566/m.267690 type:complete len:86 (+) Transcript_94566:3-260(+)